MVFSGTSDRPAKNLYFSMSLGHWKPKMQIEIKPQIITIPEIEAVEPVVTVRIYKASEIKTEAPQQWCPPLYAKTTMGYFEGSYWGYITEVTDYFGRRIYDYIRLTQEL